MIGRIELKRRGQALEATLEDNFTWTCSNRVVQTILDTKAPSGPGWRPPAAQLYEGAAALSGHVIWEREFREPTGFVEY